jgi:hypothetical protein
MANEEHLEILRLGVDAWNKWREEHREVLNPELSKPDLSWANLKGANLEGANLSDVNLFSAVLYKANLRGANLTEAKLRGASLIKADLSNAKLGGADLRWSQLIETTLLGATLTGSKVYGVSVWDIKVDDATKQQNLIITDPKDPDDPDDSKDPKGPDCPKQPVITVDDIEVAQLIYLLLNNQAIRKAIDTISSKAVLILGRFSSESRNKVLDDLRTALRDKGFLPIIFDFEHPTGQVFTETIRVLAGLSCFVIADVTDPKSVPLELQATVPGCMIPFVPIIKKPEEPFSMLANLQTLHDWVLATLRYDSGEELMQVLDESVINPALAKRHELELRKAQTAPIRNVKDYIKH